MEIKGISVRTIGVWVLGIVAFISMVGSFLFSILVPAPNYFKWVVTYLSGSWVVWYIHLYQEVKGKNDYLDLKEDV